MNSSELKLRQNGGWTVHVSAIWGCWYSSQEHHRSQQIGEGGVIQTKPVREEQTGKKN